MWYRMTLLLVFPMGLVGWGLGPVGAAEVTAGKGPPTLNELSLEVTALQALRDFQFTPAQMKTLRKLARETAPRPGARQAATSSEGFRTALADLRNALVENGDDDRIEQLQEQLDRLREMENPEVDDEIEITEAARRRVPEVFRMLSARQVAAHVMVYGADFPDPLEITLGALKGARGLEEKEWKQLREEVSGTVGQLVAGLDADKAQEIGDQVVQLLIQARALKDDQFKAQRVELEEAARRILGDVGSLDVIRHVVEQALAELLSNPRLPAALEACLKK